MTPFFTQLRYVTDVLRASRGRLDAGPERSATSTANSADLAQDKPVIIMQIVVSLIVLVGGPTLMLVHPDPTFDKVVASAIGAVVGYWFR